MYMIQKILDGDLKQSSSPPKCGPKSYKNSPQFNRTKRRRVGAKAGSSTTPVSGTSKAGVRSAVRKANKKPRSKKSRSKNVHISLQEEIEALGDLSAYKTASNLLGQEGKEGATYNVNSSLTGKCYAMKTFRTTKSGAKIAKEAQFQMDAASLNVSPRVLAHSGSGKNKYILMDKLEYRLTDLARSKEQNMALTRAQQEGVIDCAEKLDSLGILHNDGNALNLMVDEDGKVFYIDFGFSKRIDKKLLKKYGPNVNGCLTISMLVRSLRHHGISAPLLKAYVDSCKAAAKS